MGRVWAVLYLSHERSPPGPARPLAPFFGRGEHDLERAVALGCGAQGMDSGDRRDHFAPRCSWRMISRVLSERERTEIVVFMEDVRRSPQIPGDQGKRARRKGPRTRAAPDREDQGSTIWRGSEEAAGRLATDRQARRRAAHALHAGRRAPLWLPLDCVSASTHGRASPSARAGARALQHRSFPGSVLAPHERRVSAARSRPMPKGSTRFRYAAAVAVREP